MSIFGNFERPWASIPKPERIQMPGDETSDAFASITLELNDIKEELIENGDNAPALSDAIAQLSDIVAALNSVAKEYSEYTTGDLTQNTLSHGDDTAVLEGLAHRVGDAKVKLLSIAGTIRPHSTSYDQIRRTTDELSALMGSLMNLPKDVH